MYCIILLEVNDMYSFIKGKIIEATKNYVVLENSNIGYLIYVANPYSYGIDNDYKIFLYNHVREDEFSLYGFKSIEEKELFLKLINVKGIGPKMALPMFATGSVAGIVDAIDRGNVLYLTKFPKIGEKIARQIILDLKGKLIKDDSVVSSASFEELISALESLGYKLNDIKKVLPHINETLSIEVQVKEALKLLLK